MYLIFTKSKGYGNCFQSDGRVNSTVIHDDALWDTNIYCLNKNFLFFFYCTAMAEYAQLKVELAKALEAQTGSQSEQMNLVQQASELVNSCLFNL